jgi:acyl-coenzyme A thioesterase PaaI-like protein
LSDAHPAPRDQSFSAALDIRLSVVDGRTHGQIELDPAMWAPGTTVPRLGLIATFVDFVGGSPPDGAVNPTVDLRTTLVGRPPSEGVMHAVGTTLKAGSRLLLAEVIIDDGTTVFARGVTTFINRRIGPGLLSGERPPAPPRPLPTNQFEKAFAPRPVAPGVLEFDITPTIANPVANSVQGGAQATMGEMAAVWALQPQGRFSAVDLDIRYLNRTTGGPVVATGEVVGLAGDTAVVRVALTDRAADDRLVSLLTVSLSRANE